MSYKGDIKENIISIATARRSEREKLKDADINALFLGLAKIVKRSAIDEVSMDIKRQYKEAQENFTSTLKELATTEENMRQLVVENVTLHKQIDALRAQICLLLSRSLA